MNENYNNLDHYNLTREKEIIKFINSYKTPLRRSQIKEYATKIGIKNRTLTDLLKRRVKSKELKRLSHGLYAGGQKLKF